MSMSKDMNRQFAGKENSVANKQKYVQLYSN